MTGGGRRTDNRLHSAQVGGSVGIAQTRQETANGIKGILLEHETEHSAETAHLPAGNFMVRV